MEHVKQATIFTKYFNTYLVPRIEGSFTVPKKESITVSFIGVLYDE